MFNAVPKVSLSESVFRQLHDKIVRRELAPGAALPSERTLSAQLGVNRGAVREAIKRLQQAGLVIVRHGGNHTVRDYLSDGGLELLPDLVLNAQGRLDAAVVGSIMALRSVLAPELAAAAARRPNAPLADQLDAMVSRMRGQRADLKALQAQALAWWQLLAENAGNVAFRLAFNSLSRSLVPMWKVLTAVLATEFRDVENLASIAGAVRTGDADAARAAARAYLEAGRRAVDKALDAVGALPA